MFVGDGCGGARSIITENNFRLIATAGLQVLFTPNPGDKKVNLRLATRTHAPRTMTTVMLVNETSLHAAARRGAKKKSEQGRAIDISGVDHADLLTCSRIV